MIRSKLSPRALRVGFILVLVAGLLGLVGCGSKSQVSGTVTLKGEPCPGAELIFEPIDKPDQRAFVGGTTEDGTYTLDYAGKDGLPPGKYQITVTCHVDRRSGKPAPPPGEEVETFKSRARMAVVKVVFTQEINEGPNSLDFEVSEGEPAPKEDSDEFEEEEERF